MEKNNSLLVLNRSIRFSFLVGVVLLLIKMYAYWITNSAAILSDLTESIIHVFAVGFAAYSMWLSGKPADTDHPYGHDRITFFSAGFEGALIVIAAGLIIYNAGLKLLFGFELGNLSEGIMLVIVVTLINGSLGYWLIQKGKQHSSLILEAHGKHLITDCVTSCGVIVGLTAVQMTGLEWIDPAVACGTALNIICTGGRLVKRCVSGLMDQTDISFDAELKAYLSELVKPKGLSFHQLRHRHTGTRQLVEFHLVFPNKISLIQAHEQASTIEAKLRQRYGQTLDVTTHLEPKECECRPH